jgi:hypothetical protein
MADIKRLIGDDGKLVRATVSGVVVSGTFAEGWWKIHAMPAASSCFGDLVVNDYYYAPITITGTYGDEACGVDTTDMIDLAGWSLELTGDEVDVTVMDDTYKKYRKGKLDAQGSASFIFIKGETDALGGLASFFFKTADISAAGVVSNVTARSDESLVLIGFVDNETTSGQYAIATAFEVEFFNFSLPMNSSEAVKMDVPFRLVGATDPVLYKITVV